MKKVVVFFILFSYCVIGGYAEVVSYKYIFTSDFFSLKGKGAGGEDETLTLLDENKTPIKCIINHTLSAVTYDWDYQGLKIGKKPSDFFMRIPIGWNWRDNAEIKAVKIWAMGDEDVFSAQVKWNGTPMIEDQDNYFLEPTMLYAYDDLDPMIYTVPIKKRTKADEITIDISNGGKRKAVYFCALEILVDTDAKVSEQKEEEPKEEEKKKEEEEPEEIPEDAITITFEVGDGEFVANNDFKRKVNHVSPGLYSLPYAEKKHYDFNSWELPDGDRFEANEALAFRGDFTFKAVYDKAIYYLTIDGDMKQFVEELYVQGVPQKIDKSDDDPAELELHYGEEVRVVYANVDGADQVLISNIWLSNNEFCPKKSVSLKEFTFDMPGTDVVLDFSSYSSNDIIANRKMYMAGLLPEGSRVNLDLKGKHIETYDPSVGMYLRDETGSIFVAGSFGTADGFQVGKEFSSGVLNGTLSKYNGKSVCLSNASFLDAFLVDGTIDTAEVVVEEILYDFDTYEGCVVRTTGKITGQWRLSSEGVEISSILVSNKNKLGLDTIPIPSIFDEFVITGLVTLTPQGMYAIVPSSLQDIQGENQAPAPSMTSDEEPVSKIVITPAEGSRVTYIMNGEDDWSEAVTITKTTEIEIQQDTAIFYYSSKNLYANSDTMGMFYYYAPPPTYTITLHNLNEIKKIKVTANEQILKKIRVKLYQDVKFVGWSYSKYSPEYVSPDDSPTDDIDIYAIYEGWEDYYDQ